MDFSEYISFHGRSGRKYFWIGIPLAIVATVIVIVLVGFSIGTWVGFARALGVEYSPDAGKTLARQMGALLVYPCLFGLLGLFSIRRFHDRGKSGFWSLIILVPIVGLIWYFVECGFLPGSPSSNQYGDPPA
jgi:uncharacterized membrane protein YhaH (DUF805 family)